MRSFAVLAGAAASAVLIGASTSPRPTFQQVMSFRARRPTVRPRR